MSCLRHTLLLGGRNPLVCAGNFDLFFGFLLVTLFCLFPFDFLDYQEALPFVFFVSLLSMMRVLGSFIVSVNLSDAPKLETRCADTQIACTDVAALQLSAPRSPCNTILPDTPIPLDNVSFSTHWPPVLMHYY